MKSNAELSEVMTSPSTDLIRDLQKIEGDIMILGVGGKMGLSMAQLAKRAIEEAGLQKRVIGVSRFSSENLREALEASGVETIACDLLNDAELQALPDVENVIYMVGRKFGTTGNEYITWAVNTYLPGRVAEKFSNSNIVVFSSGNVYPLVDVKKAGSTERDRPNPVGEYAQSCLGRERVFTYFSRKNNTPILIFRLNYAIDMKYGVLSEIARQVYSEQPVDLSMGHVNVIWQGDANEYALRSLRHCSKDPTILNVTGPETVSVRWLAEEFARKFAKEVNFINEEAPTALLNNAGKAHQLFGYPKIPLQQMIDWTVEWLQHDGDMLDKPTHFQERQGAF